MTNYEVYFGTQGRALDSLSLLLEFPNHNRKEVRDFQKEVRDMGVTRWIKAECTNKRWWTDVKEGKVLMFKRQFKGKPEIVCRECGKIAQQATPVTELEVPYCGACRKRIDDASQNYCGHCGQKLIW